MPYKPKKPCRHPGCPALVPPGQKYCDMHRPLHPEDARSAAGRGYDSRWRKARKLYLSQPEHMFCAECLKKGRYVRATDVDHIVPHRGDKKLFWDQSNWQPLCHSCHSIKTRNEDQYPEYRY
ncbi:MAG: HNH endonuclease [Butyrivibrio sp.]|nr:HNH endonuclease [Butyrivibrio sp.]